MDNTFYVTTPIYFPNSELHIGHSYTTVAADTIARYKKARGYDVMFLTGMDEHGRKIELAAKERGITPQEHVDEIAAWTKDLWNTMDIDYDFFIRTTDDFHEEAVQKIFKTLYDQGDIYKDIYKGLYCVPCESYFTEHQLVDGKCPDCGRDVEEVEEETYFFKLSKYGDRLIKHYEDNPDFIKPQSRMNEMMNNFLKPGLEDISVSRTAFTWGVPVDFDEKHIIYVWIDALSNYITALGYESDDDSQFKKYWPADIHMMAKEIVRFHSIIWPAILMALDLPLPKKIYAHGWILFDGGKMSKSVGNIVDPKFLCDRYGSDSIRYFLMRDIVFGRDGNFTNEGLISTINSDLANDLGNLLSRTVSMVDKYFDGKLIENHISNSFDKELIDLAKDTVISTENHMDNLEFNQALEKIWLLVSRTNKYIDETTPWIVAKDDDKKGELANILYNLCESLRIISILIEPFMPDTVIKIRRQINANDNTINTWESSKKFGLLPKDLEVFKGDIIFPRIDVDEEIEELNRLFKKEEVEEEVQGALDIKDIISIEDFAKLDLRVGEVIECEKIKDSKKLLKSQVDIGGEVRQIVSGIAEHYSPEDMVGKKVIVVINLKPVKLMGELSEGMLLAGTDNGGIKLVTIERDGKIGTVIS